MPNIGDISNRSWVGLRGTGRIVWSRCPDCGLERWVPFKYPDQRCRRCAGKRNIERPAFRHAAHRAECLCMTCKMKKRKFIGAANPSWRGGIRPMNGGYVYRLVDRDDPMRSMAGRDGYVLEHRLVMARELGRPLLAWEIVHHRNGDKLDNRIQNLELWVKPHPAGAVREHEYHCPGCRCFEKKENHGEQEPRTF